MYNVGLGLVVALALAAVVLVSEAQIPCSNATAQIAEVAAKQMLELLRTNLVPVTPQKGS